MSRTYTGVVLSVDATEVSPQVHVEIGARRLALRASVRTALDAIGMVGRRVRFQAELSEHTQCLTSPVFVIGSSYGLRAVDGGSPAQPSVTRYADPGAFDGAFERVSVT